LSLRGRETEEKRKREEGRSFLRPRIKQPRHGSTARQRRKGKKRANGVHCSYGARIVNGKKGGEKRKGAIGAPTLHHLPFDRKGKEIERGERERKGEKGEERVLVHRTPKS